jgi:hypothetical protein
VRDERLDERRTRYLVSRLSGPALKNVDGPRLTLLTSSDLPSSYTSTYASASSHASDGQHDDATTEGSQAYLEGGEDVRLGGHLASKVGLGQATEHEEVLVLHVRQGLVLLTKLNDDDQVDQTSDSRSLEALIT